jgi:hypothetical protein
MVNLRRFVTGMILAICIGTPILEMFDRWDSELQDGNDTEINLVVAAVCVGVAFCAAAAVVAAVRASARCTGVFVFALDSTFATLLTLPAPIPNSRPPTPLRV